MIANGSARVRSAPTSDPAFGSVSTMVPVHSPVTSFGNHFFLLFVCAEFFQAFDGCDGQHGAEHEGEIGSLHISNTGVASSGGRPCPPISSSNCNAFQPPSA